MSDAELEVLTVDMVRCAGHGICSMVVPERVSLDEWGFAQIDPAPLADERSHRRALRAVRACPRRALGFIPVPPAPRRPTVAP